MAAELDAALLGITHFTKGSAGRDPIDRVTGSVAFGALARIVMVTARQRDGDDGVPGPRTLMRAKSNIGPDDGGFVYELQRVPLYENPDIIASVVSWGEKVEGSAREILAEAESDSDGEAKSALEEAKDFLLEILADGPKPAKEVRREASDYGVAKRTLDRAKADLNVKAMKRDMKSGWTWELPNRNPEERQ